VKAARYVIKKKNKTKVILYWKYENKTWPNQEVNTGPDHTACTKRIRDRGVRRYLRKSAPSIEKKVVFWEVDCDSVNRTKLGNI
jgi:hypothetical protein